MMYVSAILPFHGVYLLHLNQAPVEIYQNTKYAHNDDYTNATVLNNVKQSVHNDDIDVYVYRNDTPKAQQLHAMIDNRYTMNGLPLYNIFYIPCQQNAKQILNHQWFAHIIDGSDANEN